MTDATEGISLRFVALALCLAALVSVGTASTVALFVDEEQGTGSIVAADSFGPATPPGDAPAWNDEDGDGEYDQDETAYTEDDLNKGGQGQVNLPNKNIRSTRDITISVKGNGKIDLSNTRIDSGGSISISAEGKKSEIDLTNAELVAEGRISIETSSGTIILNDATCSPEATVNPSSAGTCD